MTIEALTPEQRSLVIAVNAADIKHCSALLKKLRVEDAENDYLLEQMNRLRTVPAPPKNSRNPYVCDQLGPLTVHFHGSNVKQYIGQGGLIDPLLMEIVRESFTFPDGCSITRKLEAGKRQWTLADGTRSLAFIELPIRKNGKTIGYEYVKVRAGGFAERTGRSAACDRFADSRPLGLGE